MPNGVKMLLPITNKLFISQNSLHYKQYFKNKVHIFHRGERIFNVPDRWNLKTLERRIMTLEETNRKGILHFMLLLHTHSPNPNPSPQIPWRQ